MHYYITYAHAQRLFCLPSFCPMTIPTTSNIILSHSEDAARGGRPSLNSLTDKRVLATNGWREVRGGRARKPEMEERGDHGADIIVQPTDGQTDRRTRRHHVVK